MNVHHRSTTYIAAARPCERTVSPLQNGTSTNVDFLGCGIRIKEVTPERPRRSMPPSRSVTSHDINVDRNVLWTGMNAAQEATRALDGKSRERRDGFWVATVQRCSQDVGPPSRLIFLVTEINVIAN